MAEHRERIDLPSGITVWYDDDLHAYYGHNAKTDKPSKRMTGVTTVTKTYDISPENLMRWAARTNCIGISELFAMQGGGSWLDSGEAIWQELNAFSLTYNDVRDRAATRGTNVHEVALEALARGEEIPALDELGDAERGHAQAIMSFWLDHEPKVHLCEQIVADAELNVAGRLDLVATLKGEDKPRLLDVKTGGVFPAAHVQLAGYVHLACMSGLLTEYATPTTIIKTSEDGSYQLIEGQATPDDFVLAVALYRAHGRIQGADRKAHKARTAVAA